MINYGSYSYEWLICVYHGVTDNQVSSCWLSNCNLDSLTLMNRELSCSRFWTEHFAVWTLNSTDISIAKMCRTYLLKRWRLNKSKKEKQKETCKFIDRVNKVANCQSPHVSHSAADYNLLLLLTPTELYHNVKYTIDKMIS